MTALLETPPEPQQRSRSLLPGLGVAFVALIICLPTLRDLPATWRTTQYSGHVSVMSLIALRLLYTKRAEIRRAFRESRPPALGFLGVLAAGLFEMAMYVGDVSWLAGLGVPLLMAAAIHATGGFMLLRPLVTPLACVALMIPPGFLTNFLALGLKPLVAGLAVWTLQNLGFTAIAEGYHVQLPGQRLVVTDSSCGTAAVLSLLAIAWLVTSGGARRALWRSLAVPGVFAFVIAVSVVRVVLGAELLAHYPQHEVQALLDADISVPTIALGALAILGLARALR